MSNIGVMGLGVVGTAVKKNFEKFGHRITHFDIKNNTQILEIINCRAIFICVPTITDERGSCDVSIVDWCLSELSKHNFLGTAIIKSTMLPGNTDNFCVKYPDLKICFIPEFLRQDHATEDYLTQQQNLIVGCNNDDIFNEIKLIHKDFSQNFLKLSPTEAEFVKYFVNTFNSLRVVFANIMYEACIQKNADYEKILAAATTRNVIQHDNYLKCSKTLRGFGGKCLPKDTRAFTTFLNDMQIQNTLFESILNDNEYFITK